jgi:hypothetical protein
LKKTRRVEILFTDGEYRKMLSAKGSNSVSDYIRSLIKKDCDQDSKETNDFSDLLKKLRLTDFEKLDQRMQRIELALRELSGNGNGGQLAEAGLLDKACAAENHIRMIATVLAVNARAVPGESKLFGELIGDDFTVRQPLDFIIAYLRFLSGQRPYALTHLKRLYPDLFKNLDRTERGNQ